MANSGLRLSLNLVSFGNIPSLEDLNSVKFGFSPSSFCWILVASQIATHFQCALEGTETKTQV